MKQQIQQQSTALTREIVSQERHKTYQEAVFCGRKVCAQTTSILCCPLVVSYVCLCDFSSVFPRCSYQLVQRRGGWRQWLSAECCPAPAQPAKDSGDLCVKFLDPTTICRPCQEPAIYYSTATERDLYHTRTSSIESLTTKKKESSKIQTLFDTLDPIITPAPVQQIMIEYAVTATDTHQSDENGKKTYKLEIED